MASSSANPACKHLVLDAGPLLSLSPLRGLAETYYTVPQVLDELKDKRAREHFERLGLSAGVRIQIQGPDSASLAHVIRFAKKTGDYSVLSHADLCILALTYALDVREREADEAKKGSDQQDATGDAHQDATVPSDTTPATHSECDEVKSEGGIVENELHAEEDLAEPPESEISSSEGEGAEADQKVLEAPQGEPLDVELHSIENTDNDKDRPLVHPDPTPSTSAISPPAEQSEPQPLYDDPSESDDGEGEWITPSNVALHKSRALELLPSAADPGRGKGKGRQEVIPVGCMTADFAMQNVLLQMGLGLVGVEGKRIERVKSWVLRCHACFKVCKDSSRKFCPSCGNPSLLRASVTISSPNAGPNTPAMQVHLKKNFQYKTRGTIYSIPAPKAGSAKTGPGDGLILREDQLSWMRAKKHADGKREREERRLLNAASRGAEMGDGGAILGSWMDPDWVPEIISAGAGGKGRSVRSRGMDGDMPIVGYGKKNPNERKRRK